MSEEIWDDEEDLVGEFPYSDDDGDQDGDDK